jgi:hypothetical protein
MCVLACESVCECFVRDHFDDAVDRQRLLYGKKHNTNMANMVTQFESDILTSYSNKDYFNNNKPI